jgi:hypothetical protein
VSDETQPSRIFTVAYNSDAGNVEVETFGVQEVIEVRAQLMDKALRHAAIAELEKLGYTVKAPGRPLSNDEYVMLELIRGLVLLADQQFEFTDQSDEIDDLLERARQYVENAEAEQ